MPIEFTWIEEPNIAQIRVTGKMDYSDVDHWLDLQLEALARSNYYCCLLDMRGMGIIPYNPLKQGRVIEQIRHPHLGWIAVVGTTPLITFWLEMLAKAGRLRFRTFSNSEDGLTFLRDIVTIESQKQPDSGTNTSDTAA